MNQLDNSIPDYPLGETPGLDMDPRLRRFQAEEPVKRVHMPYGGDAWLLTRYADVRAVLRDPGFSRAATVGQDLPRTLPEPDQDADRLFNMDPPDHSRLRRLIAQAFTPRRVEALRPYTAEVTARLLTEMREEGPGADLMAFVAMPLPVNIICQIFGVPTDERRLIRECTDAIFSTRTLPPEARANGRKNLAAYIADLVAERRQSPTDDLLGALVRARDEDDRLTEPELISLVSLMISAGHETTMTQIGNVVYLLLTRDDRGDSLRRDPAMIAPAVEELLRLTPSSANGSFVRITTEDIECSGTTIRAGDAVVFDLGIANRDPSVFDSPDEAVLDRHNAHHHIRFGPGIHHCPGAHLARMELQEAVAGLLREFPDLRLANSSNDVTWKQGQAIRGPAVLPVAW